MMSLFPNFKVMPLIQVDYLNRDCVYPLYKRCQNKVLVKNPQYNEWKFNQHILQSLIPVFLHTER